LSSGNGVNVGAGAMPRLVLGMKSPEQRSDKTVNASLTACHLSEAVKK